MDEKTKTVNAGEALFGFIEDEMGEEGIDALSVMCEISKDKAYQEFADNIDEVLKYK